MAGFVVSVDSGFLDKLTGYDPTDELIAALSGENDTEGPVNRSREKARLAELVLMLPLVEQDLLRMRADGVRQEDAAKILGVSQPSVSHRLVRAAQRLKFLRDFPQPSEEKLRADLTDVLSEQQIKVLWDLSLTTSQTNTARRLGFTQGKVRHALARAHQLLSARKERHLKLYAKMTTMLLDRRNMNMFVILPSCKGYQGRPVEYIGRLAAATVANDS